VEFDWTTFFLEIINFLILVWILQHFLYRPILNVIAQRRAAVDKTLADAQRIEAEATILKQQNERRQIEWAAEKEMAQARLREELAAQREQMMAALEAALAEERERRRVLEERQRQDYERAVEEAGIAQGTAFATKLLSRIATPELEARLYGLLLEDLRGLCAEDKHALADAVAAPGLQLQVQSAFALDESKRAELTLALAEVVGKKTLPLEYQENPELVAGFLVNIGPWILHANMRDELQFFSGALRHAG
jgi:F-type H+-transporting ATPase subunit b